MRVIYFDMSEEEWLFWNTLNYPFCEEEAVVSVKEKSVATGSTKSPA